MSVSRRIVATFAIVCAGIGVGGAAVAIASHASTPHVYASRTARERRARSTLAKTHFAPQLIGLTERQAAVQAADVRLHYAILRAARSASVSLPTAFITQAEAVEPRASLGMQFSAARLASVSGGVLWMIPTTTGDTCMAVGSTVMDSPRGLTCAPDSDITTDGLASEAMTPTGGTISGFVPDGVSEVSVSLASGQTSTVPVADNSFSISVSGPASAIHYLDSSGGTITTVGI
jgi:hypothetical protein